jgi:hypothetical protein
MKCQIRGCTNDCVNFDKKDGTFLVNTICKYHVGMMTKDENPFNVLLIATVIMNSVPPTIVWDEACREAVWIVQNKIDLNLVAASN